MVLRRIIIACLPSVAIGVLLLWSGGMAPLSPQEEAIASTAWLLASDQEGDLPIEPLVELTVCPQGPPVCQFAKIQEAIDAAPFTAPVESWDPPPQIPFVTNRRELEGNRMRRALGAGMILVALFGLGEGPLRWSEGAPSAIEVSCPKAEGCFSLLGEAIRQAPVGATIRITPGIYYEKPLILDKSLRIEGVTEGDRLPRIVLVEVGTAFLIRGSSRMTVELQGLAIEALAQDPFSDKNSIGVQVLAQGPEEVRVTLTGVQIRSYQGIAIGGDPQGERSVSVEVNVVNTSILTAGLGIGIGMGLGRLILRESELRGPPFPLSALGAPLYGVLLLNPPPSQRIEAVLTKTRIENFGIGLMASASSKLEQGRIDLKAVGNVIASNLGDGFYLLGDRVDAELSRNEIRGNGGYGVKLAFPECAPEGARPEFRFQGLIQGRDNSLSDNKKGDLCPEDFNWPPDFVRQLDETKGK